MINKAVNVSLNPKDLSSLAPFFSGFSRELWAIHDVKNLCKQQGRRI